MGYREKCLREKPERCVVCGSEDDIIVHHVDGDRSNNSLDNLEPMCQSCHARLHNGSGEMEQWEDRLLPQRERKRTLSLTLSKELSRDVKIIEETCPADSEPEAVKWLISHRASAVTSLRSRYDGLNELRRGANETDAEVINRALTYRVEVRKAINELLSAASKQGSLTGGEIAEILDTEELPLDYETKWSIGEE